MYSASKQAASIADAEGRPPPIPGLQKGSPKTGPGGSERGESFFQGSSRDEHTGVGTNFLRGGAVKAPGAGLDIVVERTPELKHSARVEKRKSDKEKEAQAKAQAEAEQQAKEQAEAEQQAKEFEENTHPQKGGDDDSTEGHKEGHTRVHPPEETDPKKDQQHPSEPANAHADHDDEHGGPHAYIGVALVLGFMLMFAIDHLPEALTPPKEKYTPLHISLSDLSRGPHSSSSLSLNGLQPPHTPHTPMSPMPDTPGLMRAHGPRSSATTIGLIIHAFADGIALGASSTAPSTRLSLIIFIAIMLHKAPAAFGLTSVLLKQGLGKRTARTHLGLFSLAAPAGAVCTWAVVHLLGREVMGGDVGLRWTTGWVLLFSGGTFL